MIRIITLVCIALLYFWPISVAFNFFFNQKSRAEKISYLRSFKKGKCAIVYISAVPLYCLGRVYSGQNLFSAVFDSINDIIGLVVLKYETANISALMEADSLYTFAIYSAFVIVALNALIFTISLINQYIWCSYQSFKVFRTKGDKLFIFGNSPENVSIYKSDEKRNKVIIDDIPEKEGEKLYLDGIAYVSSNTFDTPLLKMFSLMQKFDSEYIVVINTGSEEKNISLCRDIIEEISKLQEEVKERLFLKTKIFVFGDQRYETIYSDIMSNSFGTIHYLNKYKKIAIDFTYNYPLSNFLSENQVDYKTSLIKEDVDINMIMIGFGKTNRQLFLTSVANNQFLTESEKGILPKKVKYFIFDNNAAEKNKNLNHDYYRFKNECSNLNTDEYLPLPELPAEEFYSHMDINDSAFYDSLKKILKRNKNDKNFVIISFGNDLENIDFAEKLTKKQKEWEIENLTVFVKVRTWHKEDTPLSNEKCYFIGNESEIVYNIEKITNDRIFNMAQMRNEVYDLEYEIKHSDKLSLSDAYIKENHARSYKNWYMKKSQLERESSMYCVLSLRSKLNLMGLDCVEEHEGDTVGLSESEYLLHYAGDDMPDVTRYNTRALGKPIVSYPLDFPPSRRRTMAVQEHHRWNSFMITKGMIPSTLVEIKEEKTIDKDGKERYTNGKNYEVRRHGNLTTFEGLLEFRKIIAERDNCSEEKTDVIKYDYQLLDDAYWLLTSNGYKIIYKDKN